jgi:hypothetical protein
MVVEAIEPIIGAGASRILPPKLRVTSAQTEHMPFYLRVFFRVLSSWVHHPKPQVRRPIRGLETHDSVPVAPHWSRGAHGSSRWSSVQRSHEVSYPRVAGRLVNVSHPWKRRRILLLDHQSSEKEAPP